MVPEREASAQNNNLKASLRLMMANIQRMCREGTDEATDRYTVRDLDDETRERLNAISEKIGKLCERIDRTPEGEVFDAPIEEICNCTVHLKRLKESGISSLAKFFFPKKLKEMLEVLYAAEAEAGKVTQPHLFTGVIPKMSREEVFRIAREIANRKPQP